MTEERNLYFYNMIRSIPTKRSNKVALPVPKSVRTRLQKYREESGAVSWGHCFLMMLKEINSSRNVIKALSEAILNDESEVDKKGILETVNTQLSPLERMYYDFLVDHCGINNQSEKIPTEESRG